MLYGFQGKNKAVSGNDYQALTDVKTWRPKRVMPEVGDSSPPTPIHPHLHTQDKVEGLRPYIIHRVLVVDGKYTSKFRYIP